jgi:hypothetical protein
MPWFFILPRSSKDFLKAPQTAKKPFKCRPFILRGGIYPKPAGKMKGTMKHFSLSVGRRFVAGFAANNQCPPAKKRRSKNWTTG